jgi:hypothetical protein
VDLGIVYTMLQIVLLTMTLLIDTPIVLFYPYSSNMALQRNFPGSHFLSGFRLTSVSPFWKVLGNPDQAKEGRHIDLDLNMGI